MPPAKAGRSRRSRNESARASFEWWHCRRRLIGKKRRCLFSATSSIFQLLAKSSIFDRSWYNRAGVENVMGFTGPKEVQRFLKICPEIEKYITDAGIILIKFWLEVGQEEQEKRFSSAHQ